jgi:predicted short-subunit dehydrogenase-like oxidoreductase (DUF2520 family)
VLGAALSGAGHVVVGVSAVSRASLRRAAQLLPDAPVLPPDDVVRRGDLVLFAVPDDVLVDLVAGLAATGAFRAGQIVVHTSGARGVDVLAPAVDRGVLPLALHPAMTFTGRAEDVARLAGACVGVTVADETGWSVGEALVLEMGAEPVLVPPEARPLYHAALAHGANHLATLVRDAVDTLEHAGVVPAERLLGPLLEAALDNTLRHGDRALTGPVARGDLDTVRLHGPLTAPRRPGCWRPQPPPKSGRPCGGHGDYRNRARRPRHGVRGYPCGAPHRAPGGARPHDGSAARRPSLADPSRPDHPKRCCRRVDLHQSPAVRCA